uniref:Uncharacterized protein n=1 Tax=Glossina austeni TaxID=7395 RepID=A0A1A9VXN0_GLOAU
MDRKENAGNNATEKKINGKQQDDNEHNGGINDTHSSETYADLNDPQYDENARDTSHIFPFQLRLRKQSAWKFYNLLGPRTSNSFWFSYKLGKEYNLANVFFTGEISQRIYRNKATALVINDVAAERTRKGKCASDIAGHEVALAAHPEVTSRTARARKLFLKICYLPTFRRARQSTGGAVLLLGEASVTFQRLKQLL